MRDARLRKEIVIRTENRVGLLAEISGLLAEMGISLVGVTVQTKGEGADLHLLVDAHLYARDALRSAGFPVEERDVITLDLRNHPGFLCKITEALTRKGIDVEDLYASVSEGSSEALVVFTCSNNGKAVLMLRRHRGAT